MTGDYVDDFVKPLIDLGMRPSGAIPAIAEALAEDCPGATTHQLRQAVRSLRMSWKYKTFPSHSVCVEAIRSAPAMERKAAERTMPPPRESSPLDAPVVRRALRYLAEYDQASEAARACLDRRFPGRREASERTLQAYEVER